MKHPKTSRLVESLLAESSSFVSAVLQALAQKGWKPFNMPAGGTTLELRNDGTLHTVHVYEMDGVLFAQGGGEAEIESSTPQGRDYSDKHEYDNGELELRVGEVSPEDAAEQIHDQFGIHNSRDVEDYLKDRDPDTAQVPRGYRRPRQEAKFRYPEDNSQVDSTSVEGVESVLFNGVYPLKVLKPISVWKVTGSRPSNAYYGAAQIHEPTTEQVTLPTGTQLWTAHGGMYADRGLQSKLLWSAPKGAFEKSHGPGGYFGIAQKIVDGTLELGERSFQR